MNINPILNPQVARTYIRDTDPAAEEYEPEKGDVWYDTFSKNTLTWDGHGWVTDHNESTPT